MFAEAKIAEIFCLADDFCKVFNNELRTRQLQDGKSHRNKPGRLMPMYDKIILRKKPWWSL